MIIGLKLRVVPTGCRTAVRYEGNTRFLILIAERSFRDGGLFVELLGIL